MSDKMRQIAFGRLMDRALTEYEAEGSIFGIKKIYRHTGGKSYELFGEAPELPFGPAAGPHTQLAQNIVAGYAAGARFFELKTVQKLDGDDLPVSKPCILAADEGYNVEWSTELYVPQAMDEYIKGWFAIKLLSRELGLGGTDGFVFNMSVGYDLDGIKTEKIDAFIEGLKNAVNTESWRICREWALENLPRFKNIDEEYINGISPEICRSITLSTLHGCPPDEIERIASYLLTEKGLHTFIKCNPTLLGYDYARGRLDSLGFDYIAFDDHHFKSDLQFADAVPMLERLQALADSRSLSFGVKLTNTFPVQITGGELPGDEMYMSGRALFPLSAEVANRLTKAFGGRLRISFSGGVDAGSVASVYDAGIWPITLATTLLKPGGYQRLYQIATELAESEALPFKGVDPEKLQALVDGAGSDRVYSKPAGLPPDRKMKARLPLLDCFTAPCRGGCPLGQDIPAYLRLAGEGRYLEALRVITERNPLPFITGTICSRRCADKCTRSFYEGSVDIRAVKLEAAEKAFGQLIGEVSRASEQGESPVTGEEHVTGGLSVPDEDPVTYGSPEPGGKVAVVGAGPAGLSAAYFLRKAGRPVTVFEKRDSPGGIVRHVIPAFRIGDAAIGNDVALVLAAGVEMRLNRGVESLDELRSEGFETIIIATGAWKPGTLELDGGPAIDAVEFLERIKSDPESAKPGKNVVVIGGGNTAMDTARAAKRVAGVKKVSLVYRRTKRYMPADAEELSAALEDGVEFCELLAPVSFSNGALTCEKMELGAPDATGRRSPAATGEITRIPADTVISAVGNAVDSELIKSFGIPADSRGRATLNDGTFETGVKGVYIIGDAAKGPATVAEAIAGAADCSGAITGLTKERFADLNVNPDRKPAEHKKGILYFDGAAPCEPERCLECATLCECCVDVCPNRANIAVRAGGRPQIIHIDGMCNECGNCETFCPYSGAPYRDKFTLFSCAEDFENSENAGYLPLDDGAMRVRIDGNTGDHRDGSGLPDGIWQLMEAGLGLV